MIKGILISHSNGNQNSRNLLMGLNKKKKIFKFVTSLNVNIEEFPLNIFPKKVKNKLSKRSFNEIDNKKIITSNFFLEIYRLIKLRILKYLKKNQSKKYLSLIDKYEIDLCNDIDLLAANEIKKNYNYISSVYAYEKGAYNSFKVAKKYNIKCIYELPTPYWQERQKILSSELKSYNNDQLLNKFSYNKKLNDKLFNKLDLEVKYADIIIVPSQFVKKTILSSKFKNKKIIVIPYGFPKTIHKNNWFNKKRKIEILFVGNLLPNKGLLCLFKTIEFLSKIENGKFNLTIIGSGPLESWLKKKLPNTIFKKYLTNIEVLKEMKKKDIFLFPTLYEGLSLSICEAMSRGMVVISTYNSGLLEFGNKQNSILVNVNDHIQIAKKISFLINNPKKVKYLGNNAIKTSKKNNWESYRSKIMSKI